MELVSSSTEQSSTSGGTAAISVEQALLESKGTLLRDTVPVIIASMRGGHRCLATTRSNCKFIKFLSGREDESGPKTKTSFSSVPAVDFIEREDDERVNKNEEGPSRVLCIKCLKNICPGCRQGFKLPKYLRAHIIGHRCKGKMKK